jgi:hypothetical protein
MRSQHHGTSGVKMTETFMRGIGPPWSPGAAAVAVAARGLALCMALVACDSSGSKSGLHSSPDADAFTTARTDASTATPPPPRTYAPTYTAVWDEILAPSCAWLYCHGGDGLLFTLHTKEGGYDSLLEPAAGVDCKDTGLRRIEPGEPDRSLAILKLSEPPPCGDRMPIALVASALPPEDIEQLRAWVARGAPED